MTAGSIGWGGSRGSCCDDRDVRHDPPGMAQGPTGGCAFDRPKLNASRHLAIQQEGPVAHKRTTHRSSAGKKLYAIRDAKGKFMDIQTHERVSRQDQLRRSQAERQAKKR